MNQTMRMFPVMPRFGSGGGVAYVPWALVAPHEKQATLNHYQTLERLATRGGLAPCELLAVLEGRKWKPMDAEESWRGIIAKMMAPQVRWIVAKENAENVPGYERPQLSYVVVAEWPTFTDQQAAHQFIKEHQLPLGWVVMKESQLNIHAR